MEGARLPRAGLNSPPVKWGGEWERREGASEGGGGGDRKRLRGEKEQ